MTLADGLLKETPVLEVVSSFDHEAPQFEALVTIGGMTCSSCSAQVTEALKSLPWVRSADVNLLSNCATVGFKGEERSKEICAAIEAIGYDATLEHVTAIVPTAASSEDSLWRASYAVGGMTCSSCVATVTNALKAHDWIQDAVVNLVSHEAIVIFSGRNHTDEISETIEDAGYEARLVRIDNSKSPTQPSERTVLLRVEGIYCEHCAFNIRTALRSLGHEITIGKAPSIQDPIIKLTYTPDAPDFTIRHIMTAIASADAAFKLSIFHPPTLEERARDMQLRERRRLLYRVIFSIVVAIPTFIIGIVLMSLVSSRHPARQYLMSPLSGVSRAQWGLFVMATPVYFFAADVFHRRALTELYSLWRKGSRTPIARRFYRFGSMNMLISFGTSIAYFSSIAELTIDATRRTSTSPANGSFYFDSVVFLTMFLLIGRLIEAYSKAKSGEAVALLSKLRPTEAVLIEGINSETIDVDLLEAGDTIRISHGTSPACDGVVTAGDRALFDESSLTGESKQVSKKVGDEVYAGTVNRGEPISIRISKTAGTSMLDQIIQVVREGQTKRAPIERVADILTSYFVPVITLLAMMTWFIWLGLGLGGILPRDWLDVETGGWPFWSLQFAIAVFIVACPCGIGLAAPTALFVGGGLAASHGILVKGGGEAFQEASSLDIVVFDKTGTLTQGGDCIVSDHRFLLDDEKNDPRQLAALKALEEQSSHPIAKALVTFCKSSETPDIQVSDLQEIPGKGMKGTFASATEKDMTLDLIAGNESLMNTHNVQIPLSASETLSTWKGQGRSVVLVASRLINPELSNLDSQFQLICIFALSDPIRPESSLLISSLHRRDINTWLLSGDNPTTANAVGASVGIPADHVIAGVLPDQKADKINYLQRSQPGNNGKRATVAMVGDGINDAPALTAADVGIAVGSGSDVAISSADFVLLKSNISSLLTLLDLSRTVFRRVKFNFAWALVYNVIAVPIAAGCLYPVVAGGKHVRLDPVWASLAMALSSLSVVASSLALRSGLPLLGFRERRVG